MTIEGEIFSEIRYEIASIVFDNLVIPSDHRMLLNGENIISPIIATLKNTINSYLKLFRKFKAKKTS